MSLLSVTSSTKVHPAAAEERSAPKRTAGVEGVSMIELMEQVAAMQNQLAALNQGTGQNQVHRPLESQESMLQSTYLDTTRVTSEGVIEESPSDWHQASLFIAFSLDRSRAERWTMVLSSLSLVMLQIIAISTILFGIDKGTCVSNEDCIRGMYCVRGWACSPCSADLGNILRPCDDTNTTERPRWQIGRAHV